MGGLRRKKVGAWGVGSGMFWVFGVAPAKGVIFIVRVLGAFGVSIAEVQVP